MRVLQLPGEGAMFPCGFPLDIYISTGYIYEVCLISYVSSKERAILSFQEQIRWIC